MVRRGISTLLVASALCGAAVAQWTQIADDPCVWSYGDSIGNYAVPTMGSASTFANGKFWVIGGYGMFDLSWGVGSDRVQLKEGTRAWDWNRQSKVSAYTGAAWETAGTQDLLVNTGDVVYNDALSVYMLGDLSTTIFPGDFVKIVSGRGIQAGENNSFGLVVNQVVYDAGVTYLVFEGTCCSWMHVPDTWINDPDDKIYITTSLGHTGMNNWDTEPGGVADGYNAGAYPPLLSNGNFSYAQTNCGAYDKDNDGTKEIYVFGGYPNWKPGDVDIYNPATGEWSSGASVTYGGEARGAGGQVGDKFVWNTLDNNMEVYDFATDTWTEDPIGAGYTVNRRANIVGIGGTAYILSGPNRLDAYVPLSGVVTPKAAPPVTGWRASAISYLDRYLIAFGGTMAENDFATLVDDIQIYDTTTDTWTVSSVKMPYKGANVAVGLDPVSGTVYLTGGVVGYNPDADPPNNASHPANTKEAYKIHISQLIPTTVSVSGKLGLEFHVNVGSVTGTLEVYAVGGGTVLETKSLTLDGSGNFTTTLTLGPGNYDLRFGAPNYLWKRLGNVVLSGGSNNVGTVNLICGDGNANNQIELGDLNQVLINFGGTGSGDYDGSGSVGLADLNIVLVNFGKTGDN
ncbi:MAG: hypothetical protein HRF45_01150 [Fimbriimonadia bacterium]|jgi:hypothetical protein